MESLAVADKYAAFFLALDSNFFFLKINVPCKIATLCAKNMSIKSLNEYLGVCRFQNGVSSRGVSL